MDQRSKMLMKALVEAREDNAIMVVFYDEGIHEWRVYTYETTLPALAEQVRYVLPNGEVTKLS